MSHYEEQRATELLKKCKSLGDAEKYFGGKFNASTGGRDWKKASVAWGLWEGWSNLPCTCTDKMRDYEDDYKEAWEIGRRLSLVDLPS